MAINHNDDESFHEMILSEISRFLLQMQEVNFWELYVKGQSKSAYLETSPYPCISSEKRTFET